MFIKVLKLAGPGYRSDDVFDLSNMQPYTLKDLILPFQALTQDVALYLPRTSDLRQLGDCVKGDKKITVVHYCVEGASKVSRIKEHLRILSF